MVKAEISSQRIGALRENSLSLDSSSQKKLASELVIRMNCDSCMGKFYTIFQRNPVVALGIKSEHVVAEAS